MDVIFDIDGTLADAKHRLHFIKEKPTDWKTFLSDEEVSQDAAIIQIWMVLEALHVAGDRILFITGRDETSREMTTKWLKEKAAAYAPEFFKSDSIYLFMRTAGDHQPSEVSKKNSLNDARSYGFNPRLVFEDRIKDTAMWRSENIRCCQVADGNY